MNLLKLLRFTIIILLLVSFFAAGDVRAKTAEEIQKDIETKQQELTKLNEKLKSAEATLKSQESSKNKSLSEIESVKLELSEVESNLEISSLNQQKLKGEIDLKALEKEDLTKKMDGEITDAYINWKTDDITQTIFGSDDIVKMAVYQNYVAEQSRQHILGISTELTKLNDTNTEYENQIGELETQKTAFAEQKTQLEKKISELNSAIAANANNKSTLRSQIQNVQQQIDGLSQEWLDAQNNFNNLPINNNNGGTQPLVTGQLYISGTMTYDGNDSKQKPLSQTGDGFGHGIGLSQWGAYGAAASGMTAWQIVNFYYTGTTIMKYPGKTINVKGYGVMSVEQYVAGLGEVPDKACGTAEQAAQNPAKFVKDNTSSLWDCWPAEAIKAQVIAARSYGVTSGQPICTTATCQVYKGGNAKAWAADETKDEYVVTWNWQIIRAFYSAYNNNGWGTSDNDTLWSDKSGNGTNYSYLRAVNDSAFTYNYSYKHKSWRTNSYSLQSLDSMFDWCAANCSSKAWITTNVKNKIGKLASVTTIKDGSGRVKKVVLKGTNGQTTTLAGWFFRDVYNLWVTNVNPSGQKDFIQSLSFSILSV